MLDYRGYGKSGSKISSEAQLHRDMQTVYDYLKKMYPENHIIILGHSMGTGLAARLASKNHPKKLILQAPYYSVADWVFHLVEVVRFSGTLNLQVLYSTPVQTVQGFCSPVTNASAVYCNTFQCTRRFQFEHPLHSRTYPLLIIPLSSGSRTTRQKHCRMDRRPDSYWA